MRAKHGIVLVVPVPLSDPYLAQQHLDNPQLLGAFPLHLLPHQWGEPHLSFNSW